MTKRTAIKNIRKVMVMATDEEIYKGSRWYSDTLELCENLAVKYGFPVQRVVYALAALSPGIRWTTAVAALTTLLGKWSSFERVKVAGYPANVEKARRILNGDIHVLSGQKVQAFAANILDSSSIDVTVDVHAYSIAAGRRYTVDDLKTISAKSYRLVTSAYASVGREYGITPAQCQAICWVAWRRKIGLYGLGKRRARLD